MSTVVQNVSGTLLESSTPISFDMVGTGPGSQSTRKALSPIAGITLPCAVKHEVTNAGRRRSVIRVDVKAPIGIATFGDAAGVPHSASAYLTVDRLENDSNEEKLVVDHAVSALLNLLVNTRVATGAFEPTVILKDFLNGEP
jgi:hypothetical protein